MASAVASAVTSAVASTKPPIDLPSASAVASAVTSAVASTKPPIDLPSISHATLCAASHLALAHTLILRPCHFDSIYGPRARHHTCARPPLRRVHVPAACAVAALPERDGLLTPAFHLLSCSPAPASRWLMLQLRSCADSPVRFCQECSCHDRPCPSPAAAGLRRSPLGN